MNKMDLAEMTNSNPYSVLVDSLTIAQEQTLENPLLISPTDCRLLNDILARAKNHADKLTGFLAQDK